MVDIPVKKYRVRRAKKWLKRTLIPFGMRKGCYLIGCDTTGSNAFFLRDDIKVPDIPTLTSREAFRPHANWLARGILEAEQLAIIQSMPYQEV